MRSDVILTLQIQIRVTEDHHPRPISVGYCRVVIDVTPPIFLCLDADAYIDALQYYKMPNWWFLCIRLEI